MDQHPASRNGLHCSEKVAASIAGGNPLAEVSQGLGSASILLTVTRCALAGRGRNGRKIPGFCAQKRDGIGREHVAARRRVCADFDPMLHPDGAVGDQVGDVALDPRQRTVLVELRVDVDRYLERPLERTLNGAL